MIDKHHPIIKIIEPILQNLSPKSLIYDIGTSSRFAKEVGLFKKILNKHNYLAVGYNSPKCDINADAHHLPFKNNTADLILCFELIEHVKNPYQVISEIHRVLKPEGKLILTTPFLSPYHGKGANLNDGSHESYPDFWRFTHQGLELLCHDFKSVKVYPFTSTFGYYLYLFFNLLNLNFIYTLIQKTPLINKFRGNLGNPTFRHLVVSIK